MLMPIHLPTFGKVIAGYIQLQGFCNNDNPGLIVFWLHARKPPRSLYLDCFSQKYLSRYSSVLYSRPVLEVNVGKAWRSVAVKLGKQIASTKRNKQQHPVISPIPSSIRPLRYLKVAGDV
jgi:hypothetical protein